MARRPRAVIDEQQALRLDQAVRNNAKSAYHGRLALPGDSTMRYGGGATLSVWIDPATGATLMEHHPRSMAAGSRMMFEWIFPTHTGDIAGPAGRLVMFIAGIIPMVLFATGLWIWSSRRSMRRPAQKSALAEAARP